MKRRTLYEGKYKRLVSEKGWEYVERVNCGGVVAILAVTEENEIILVEQIRVPVGRKVIELPAGLVSDKLEHDEETVLEAGRRELLEETGYQAEKIVPFMVMPSSPALCGEMIHLVRAFGLKKVGEGGGDHMESIVPYAVKLDKINEWLVSRQEAGSLIDPKVYAAVYFLRLKSA